MTETAPLDDPDQSPYRFVGMSTAYVAARMPDGTMAEGVGDTMEQALADAHQRWQERRDA